MVQLVFRFECFDFDAITRSLAASIYGPGHTIANSQKYVNYFFGPQVLRCHFFFLHSHSFDFERLAFDYLKCVGLLKIHEMWASTEQQQNTLFALVLRLAKKKNRKKKTAEAGQGNRKCAKYPKRCARLSFMTIHRWGGKFLSMGSGNL